MDASPPLGLDLAGGEIETIIWATGFRPDYSWLDGSVLDPKGMIRHDGGVADSPGMFLIGSPFLRRRKSSFIDGARVDAEELVVELAAYLDAGASLARRSPGHDQPDHGSVEHASASPPRQYVDGRHAFVVPPASPAATIPDRPVGASASISPSTGRRALSVIRPAERADPGGATRHGVPGLPLVGHDRVRGRRNVDEPALVGGARVGGVVVDVEFQRRGLVRRTGVGLVRRVRQLAQPGERLARVVTCSRSTHDPYCRRSAGHCRDRPEDCPAR